MAKVFLKRKFLQNYFIIMTETPDHQTHLKSLVEQQVTLSKEIESKRKKKTNTEKEGETQREKEREREYLYVSFCLCLFSSVFS